jgi:uncharacterized protein (TIGR03437 family)
VANVQVTFDGIPVSLLYVGQGQVNAIAPWSLQVGKTTDVCVVSNGLATNCLKRQVVQTAPGVFLAGDGFAAALNEDGTINSADNPAKQGSIVTARSQDFRCQSTSSRRKLESLSHQARLSRPIRYISQINIQVRFFANVYVAVGSDFNRAARSNSFLIHIHVAQ